MGLNGVFTAVKKAELLQQNTILMLPRSLRTARRWMKADYKPNGCEEYVGKYLDHALSAEDPGRELSEERE